jgi:predicted HNH restriction endonuclease
MEEVLLQVTSIIRNKEKKKEYDKKYKKENRVERTKYAKVYAQKVKEQLVALFGNFCILCGNTYHQSVYDFHHLNPKEKDFTIAKATSIQVAYKEAQKCIMLCANCHRTIHTELDYNLSGY